MPIYKLRVLEQMEDIDQTSISLALLEPKNHRLGTCMRLAIVDVHVLIHPRVFAVYECPSQALAGSNKEKPLPNVAVLINFIIGSHFSFLSDSPNKLFASHC